MRIKSTRGFSVLEILLAVAISSVLITAIYVVLNSSRNIWLVTDASVSNQGEARRAMMDMERQIRGGSGFSFPTDDSISFTLDHKKNDITYRLVGTHIERETRREGTSVVLETRDLAYNIKTLQFTPLPSIANLRKVLVTIELEKAVGGGDSIGFSLTQILKVRSS